MPQAVLIIDDEIEVANTCARVLRNAGFDCLIAEDAPEALALLASHQPDLVLSDLHLPTSSGYEIARYVRAKSPATPVILMTGQHSSDVPAQAARAGAAAYLRKPFSNAELTRAVISLLADSYDPD